MATQDVAAAMQRVQTVLRRRPQAALTDDSEATARWEGGTRVATTHPGGACVASDLPSELGGSGDQVSPGWLFRAGLAACAVTAIAMRAAEAGITLDALDIIASSRSDTRGLLGMMGVEGSPAFAGTQDLRMVIRIGAREVGEERLRALVAAGLECAPVYVAMRPGVPIAVHVEIVAP